MTEIMQGVVKKVLEGQPDIEVLPPDPAPATRERAMMGRAVVLMEDGHGELPPAGRRLLERQPEAKIVVVGAAGRRAMLHVGITDLNGKLLAQAIRRAAQGVEP